MTAARYPVFIIVRDRYESLRHLIDWCERVGQTEIHLIDNDSTYPPLVELLSTTPHHVHRLGRNLGHRSPWLSGIVQRTARDRFHVVSDPDVIPDPECPTDALDHFRVLLEAHPDIHKAGFGLRIDDLPGHNPLTPDIIEWESRFWSEEIEPGVYRAPIDTTFALYRPLPHRASDSLALRTGAPYLARHTPWYLDPNDLAPDEAHYRLRLDPAFSNWDRDQLPRWKRRWLHASRPD